MNNVLIYCRPKKSEAVAEQTADILSGQLQEIGLNVHISHVLNLPRLLLNTYQTVHFIIENLPLSVNEALYISICKALGKSTVLSVLNSENKINKNVLGFIKPDAFSVSQTNHLKLYRNVSGNKFIFSAFPKTSGTTTKNKIFKGEAFLIPLQNKIEEAFEFKLNKPIYFDGRKLLKNANSSQLRKKWNELIVSGKIKNEHHLVLSENKLNQLIDEESLAIVLAEPALTNTELVSWLNVSLNKNNLIILNDFQATGFANYWTSGYNCLVISSQNWKNHLEQLAEQLENTSQLVPSTYHVSELFEPAVNELSRLYAKLWQQKTSLLTSRSVKL